MGLASKEEALILRKKEVVEIKKASGLSGQKAKVKLCLDFSGSMEDLYDNGTVDSILERLLPVAMAFDDDEKIDLYLFHEKAIYIGELGKDDISGLAASLRRKYSLGGTNYAPPIEEILKEFKAETPSGKSEVPTYVIFMTDGKNFDEPQTKSALIECSKHGIFFQFVGIGDATLEFLEKLDDLSGRFLDNANFFQIGNINHLSDADLYKQLMAEFPSWLKQAQDKNLVQ